MAEKKRHWIIFMLSALSFAWSQCERLVSFLSGALFDDASNAKQNIELWFNNNQWIGGVVAQNVTLFIGIALAVVNFILLLRNGSKSVTSKVDTAELNNEKAVTENASASSIDSDKLLDDILHNPEFPEKMKEMMRICSQMVNIEKSIDPGLPDGKSHVIDCMRMIIAPQIKTTFGKRFHDKFIEKIDSSINETQSPFILCRSFINFIGNHIIKTAERYNRNYQNAKSKQNN